MGVARMNTNNIPRHVAIIMDGNGRWAKKQNLIRLVGHNHGAVTVRMVVETSVKVGIKYLTLYAFSTENWARPKREVAGLMSLLSKSLHDELPTLRENGIRLRGMGEIDRLPSEVQERLRLAEEATKDGKNLDLMLALSYGGRKEIVDAVAQITKKGYAPDEITEELIKQHLYLPDVPDPDLLIRTAGEYRISNFLLWQIAYSELRISNLTWPEFTEEEYRQCVHEFSLRERKFGMCSDQLPKKLATI